MSIAIDPSEMRAPVSGRAAEVAPRRPAPPSRLGRLVLLTALGGVGLVGLSAGAYSMLSGLAGPPPGKVRMGRVSADWPDLRDGVPALVSTGSAIPSAGPAAGSVAPVEAGPAKAAAALREIEAVESKGRDVKPAPVAAIAVEPGAAAVKPARLPPIENAATLAPAPAVALVEKARTAPVVAPTATETTRARAATGGTFAALPPAEKAEKTATAKPAASAAQGKLTPKPAVKVAAKPAEKPAAKPGSVAPEKAAAAAQPAPAADAEETEMFGVKVPSLAPMGRKFAEGVEALGNAVKRLPDQF